MNRNKKKVLRRGVILGAMAAMVFVTAGCAGDPANNNSELTVQMESGAVEAYESQQLEIASVMNTRQLGGYIGADGRAVRDNLLIRTASLINLTEEDAQKLAETYHVTTVVDFRSSVEQQTEPDPEIPGAKNIPISVMEGQTVGINLPQKKEGAEVDPMELVIQYVKSGHSTDLYRNIVLGELGQQGFGQFFDLLLEQPEDEAILWHCRSGKDRTGIAAALLLEALGVDEDTIYEDFELSNVPYLPYLEKVYHQAMEKGCTSEEAWQVSLLMTGVNVEQLRSAFAAITEEYGSVREYLHHIGVTEEDIAQLQEKYLEPRS